MSASRYTSTSRGGRLLTQCSPLLISSDVFGVSQLKLAHDGLERELKFFNPLEGCVCTTCAPADQEKSIVSKHGWSLFGVMRVFRWGRVLACDLRDNTARHEPGLLLGLPSMSPQVAVRTKNCVGGSSPSPATNRTLLYASLRFAATQCARWSCDVATGDRFLSEICSQQKGDGRPQVERPSLRTRTDGSHYPAPLTFARIALREFQHCSAIRRARHGLEHPGRLRRLRGRICRAPLIHRPAFWSLRTIASLPTIIRTICAPIVILHIGPSGSPSG